MRVQSTIGKVLIGFLAAACLALGTTAIVSAQPATELPIQDKAAQASYAAEVDSFLSARPEPQSGQFGFTVDEQNGYWAARAAWWEAVPWAAVAGQWGCTTGAVSVAFNSPREDGVVTAGFGGSGDCGGYYDRDNAAIFSDPRTKA